VRSAFSGVVVVVLVCVVAGCSPGGGEEGPGASGGGGESAAAAVTFARSYQEAVNGQDWQRICGMRTERYRHGTVEACVEDNAEPAESVEPSPVESGDPPLRRADGSVIPPRETAAAGGPERAETGAVKAGGAVAVPAVGDHPAGTGVLVEYEVIWPDSTSTSRKALRLVEEGDGWLVDQAEDVADSDQAHGNPIHDALARMR